MKPKPFQKNVHKEKFNMQLQKAMICDIYFVNFQWGANLFVEILKILTTISWNTNNSQKQDEHIEDIHENNNVSNFARYELNALWIVHPEWTAALLLEKFEARPENKQNQNTVNDAKLLPNNLRWTQKVSLIVD